MRWRPKRQLGRRLNVSVRGGPTLDYPTDCPSDEDRDLSGERMSSQERLLIRDEAAGEGVSCVRDASPTTRQPVRGGWQGAVMRIGKWAKLLLLGAPILAGCSGFWNAPSGGNGTGGCTTNCSTSGSGNFYILNNGTTPQLLGYSFVAGVLTPITGSPFAVDATPFSMTIATGRQFHVCELGWRGCGALPHRLRRRSGKLRPTSPPIKRLPCRWMRPVDG